MSNNSENRFRYQHLLVIIEHEAGELVPVSLEMLGEARRLMDGFNKKYDLDEKVIAVVLGNNIRQLCQDLIYYGADAVIYAESPELEYSRNLIDTKVICQISLDSTSIAKISSKHSSEYKKPRYMFFAADSIGRHLSSTVLAELESGLASDINKLEVEDIELRHEHKTKGQTVKYSKVLQMYRPDFSGFLWTTILCLDNRNPLNQKDFHPQACSIIPGVFQPVDRDDSRKGQIVEFKPIFDPQDLNVKILSRKIIKSEIDYDSHRTVVSFGRGIKDSPDENIKIITELARLLDAEIGISLPLSKKLYQVNESSSGILVPERVIGTSGRKVSPSIYIAIGISGAVQHLAGMKDSEFIIAINQDGESPIKDESDLFIHGRLEDVIPTLIEEIKKQKNLVEVHQ